MPNKGTAGLAGWRRLIAGATLLAILLFNAVACMQAAAMTRFAGAGERTAVPEQLSALDRAWTVISGVNIPRPRNVHNPADVGLAYETVVIPSSNGATLEGWLVEQPRSRGIVALFHGYAAGKDSLLRPAAALHGLGYDLLLVDFQGSGGSSGSDTTLGVREGADVANTLSYLRHHRPGKDVILYGVSMGSAAILRAVAMDGARPDAVILESGFDRLLTTVRHRFEATGLPAFPGAEAIVFWGSLQRGFDGFGHNPADYARSVTCPALLLHGEHDPRVTTAETRAILDNLRGPKRLVEFPGAGHELLALAAPESWRGEVASFLDTLPAAPETVHP